MAKDAQRADRIRSLKNLITIAKEQGRQLRVQELELELKKLQGVAETSDYFRRREREEAIISGQKSARKKQPAQTSDYARRRAQEKKTEQGVAVGSNNIDEAIKSKLSVGTKVHHPVHGPGTVHMVSHGGGSMVPKDSAIVKFGDQKKPIKIRDLKLKEEVEGVAEAKPQKKADRYHINKDGKPATLASYPDKESAVKIGRAHV